MKFANHLYQATALLILLEISTIFGIARPQQRTPPQLYGQPQPPTNNYNYQQVAAPSIPSIQPQSPPSFNRYDTVNQIPGSSTGPICQKQVLGNELRFVCAGPTPTFHTKYILWLQGPQSSAGLPPIRIEVPNYKLDDWIQAGFKSTQTIPNKSVINVLVKRPELSYQASAETAPTPNSANDAEVNLEYEAVQDKVVHFPTDGRLEILPPNSIPEPSSAGPSSLPQIDVRQYFRRSPSPPPPGGLYKREAHLRHQGYHRQGLSQAFEAPSAWYPIIKGNN